MRPARRTRPALVGGIPLEDVFERHYPDVYRYLARRVPAAVAEDLASETFVQVAARSHTYDPAKGVLRAWIFGIASNLLAGRVDSQALRRALVEALADLSDADRDVLLLVVLADLSPSEVATALDLPAGPGSAFASLTFREIPKDPVDVNYVP